MGPNLTLIIQSPLNIVPTCKISNLALVPNINELEFLLFLFLTSAQCAEQIRVFYNITFVIFTGFFTLFFSNIEKTIPESPGIKVSKFKKKNTVDGFTLGKRKLILTFSILCH